MTLGTNGQYGVVTSADKDRECFCPRCRARITESPSSDLEYGHKPDCPRRPSDDRIGYSNSGKYDPSLDIKRRLKILADGGQITCGDCGGAVDPANHKVLLRPVATDIDLCVECQPHHPADRQFSPAAGGGEA